MKMKTSKNILRKKGERSFTLIEVVVAVGLMASLLIEVSSVQGNSVFFSQYGRNVTQATWLAQGIMSKVEYYWSSKPFPDLKTKLEGQPFKDYPDYQWSLEIKEWKFPFTQILTGGFLGGGEEGEEAEEDPMTAIIESVTDQVFADEPIFMTAHVEVSWADGAARDSTSLTYLITNQSKLDETMVSLKPVYDKLTKPPAKKKTRTTKKVTNPANGQPVDSNGGGN